MPPGRAASTLSILSLLVYVGVALWAGWSASPPADATDPATRARFLHEAQRYDPGPDAVARLLDEDRETLSRAVELAPTWAAYRLALALRCLEAGDVDAAAREFRLARRFSPTWAGLRQAMGEAWVDAARGRDDPALLLFALPELREATRLEPGSLGVVFDELADMFPDLTALAPLVPDDASCRAEYGRRLLESGFAVLAVGELSLAVLDPELRTEENYFRLGRARLLAGDLAGARESFETALSLSPDPDASLRRLYACYHGRRDAPDLAAREEAGERFWRDMLARRPRGAQFNLARLHYQRGEYREAKKGFDLVGRLGDDPDAEDYVLRILTSSDWHYFARAEERARAAILRFPEREARFRLHLARALRGEGRLFDAIRELERVCDLEPDSKGRADTLTRWRKEAVLEDR